MARVPFLEQDDLDEPYQDLVVSSLQPGKRVNVYSAIANNPDVLEGMRTFLGSLWSNSGLEDREREIVILTAAAEVSSTYEWHQHVLIGMEVGLDEKAIRAIGADDRTPFDREEQALIAYARAVVRGRVNDPLHDAVMEQFDEETVVGIAATAAGYLALGRLIDAFDVELETGDAFVGWGVRE